MNRKWPRILVVDDQTFTLWFLEYDLRRNFEGSFRDSNTEHQGKLGLDGQIVGALGGNMALRLLREEGPFDVIVTDLLMDDLSGPELLSRIRTGETENESCGTPKDVLVGACSVAAVENYGEQFDFYVSKNSLPDLLVVEVLKALVKRNGNTTVLNEQSKRKFISQAVTLLKNTRNPTMP